MTAHETAQVIAYAVLLGLMATVGSWLTARFRRGWIATVALSVIGAVLLWLLGLFPGATSPFTGT